VKLTRYVALLAAPAVVGAAAALAIRLEWPATDAYAQARLWIPVLLVGLVCTAGAVALRWVRWRVNRAASAAREAAAVEHRRFLLRLDHELKNPVTAIQAGLANVAAGNGAVDPAAVHSVATQARRLADLVADLRKLAELETRPIERAPVDIAEMLTELHDAAQELPGAQDRSLALVLPQAPWPLGTIPGDRDLLFLAIHNLLGNALKFSNPGDRIELRAREDGDQAVVEVADTGIGIPVDEVDQVWDELARGTAAAGTPGSGLGLALARVIVARHGGSVSLRSRAGNGTLVGFPLPAG
jgi:two-component system OmpR family sensor kinase